MNNSPINLGLTQVPITNNKELFDNLFPIYEAFRRLSERFDGSVDVMANYPYPPILISEDESFVIPANTQVLFSQTIENNGLLVIDGLLIEVD